MYHIEMMHFKRKSELEIELLKKQIRNEELKFRKLSGENDEIQVTTEQIKDFNKKKLYIQNAYTKFIKIVLNFSFIYYLLIIFPI